jgi:hypothetical protein
VYYVVIGLLRLSIPISYIAGIMLLREGGGSHPGTLSKVPTLLGTVIIQCVDQG